MSVNSKMTAIADAIRGKTGGTTPLTLDQMATEINNISVGVDLPELTNEGTASDLMKGKQMISGAGVAVTGSFTLDSELTEQDSLIEQIKTALAGKAAGGGGSTEPDPSDQYQRVEYIESAEEDTYPYIITDIYADNNTGVEVVASFSVMADRIPMGSREDSGATRFYCCYPLSTSSCYYGFNVGGSISCTTKINTVYRLQTNFMNSRQAIVYEENGTRKAFANFTQTLSDHTVPIAIFGYNSASNGTVTSKREYKLYSARLSKGFDIIREYIPCYRKSDGVVGLYEKFTRTFLTAETGTFTKGADVAWDYAA